MCNKYLLLVAKNNANFVPKEKNKKALYNNPIGTRKRIKDKNLKNYVLMSYHRLISRQKLFLFMQERQKLPPFDTNKEERSTAGTNR
jgi:hypothetical protein